MRRAQSMAHAALRPPKMLSSWSCIGPRRRANAIQSDGQEPLMEPSSTTEIGTSEPLSTSPCDSAPDIVELPVSSSDGVDWDSEASCSHSSSNIHHELDVDVADGESLTEQCRNEDVMTEVDLWHQLEHELYDRAEGVEGDVEKEIREEEEAAMQEVGASEPEGSPPLIKEAHRFFPPGKIMHIITLHERDEENERSSSSSSSSDGGDRHSTESKVGIFQTPRSLYSKLRLSHSMISDHFMPVYRRQIEKLIGELEKQLEPELE